MSLLRLHFVEMYCEVAQTIPVHFTYLYDLVKRLFPDWLDKYNLIIMNPKQTRTENLCSFLIFIRNKRHDYDNRIKDTVHVRQQLFNADELIREIEKHIDMIEKHDYMLELMAKAIWKPKDEVFALSLM